MIARSYAPYISAEKFGNGLFHILLFDNEPETLLALVKSGKGLGNGGICHLGELFDKLGSGGVSLFSQCGKNAVAEFIRACRGHDDRRHASAAYGSVVDHLLAAGVLVLREVVVRTVGNAPQLAPAEGEEEFKVGRRLGIEAKGVAPTMSRKSRRLNPWKRGCSRSRSEKLCSMNLVWFVNQ